MGYASSRADRFVTKLYTRGMNPAPNQDAAQKEAKDVLQRLTDRRARVIRRNLRGT